MQSQEVSRAHSTFTRQNSSKRNLSGQERKERIYSVKKLHPQYVAGFVDGEGSFWVSVALDKRNNKIFPRAEFSIELRADDREILERIKATIGCGKLYKCNYERYGWYPHVKYKVSRFEEITNTLIPFFEKYPLQAKQAKRFFFFKKIIEKKEKGEHLTKKGVQDILKVQRKIRELVKKHRIETARVRENRSPSGVRQ